MRSFGKGTPGGSFFSKNITFTENGDEKEGLALHSLNLRYEVSLIIAPRANFNSVGIPVVFSCSSRTDHLAPSSDARVGGEIRCQRTIVKAAGVV